MLSIDKTGLLKAFLGGLPGPVAARLAMAVEVDRLMEGAALPHAEILEGLRPQLRHSHEADPRATRAPTPLRLFCRPFEDLLVSLPRTEKQKAVIARSSLEPVWNWIAGSLMPDAASAFVHETRALVVANRMDAALARTMAFWPLAAAAMQGGLAETGNRKALQNQLGGAMALADAEEMALLLSAGPAIVKLQDMLPAPVPGLTETLLWDVRGIYDGLAREQADVAPYVPVIAMNRLARPCEALRLPQQVTRHTDDVLISKTDMGLVGEILFARMEALKNAIQAARHPFFDPDTLAEQVKCFTDLSGGITREIGIRREGEWGKRLLADRAVIGKVMDGFMDRAPREILAALPLARGTGPKSADFSRPVPEEKQHMALDYARLMAKCRPLAAAAAFASCHKQAQDETGAELRRYIEDVLRILRDGSDPRFAVAKAQFDLCVSLVELLFSAEEGELLRRRGRAAAPQ